MGQLDIFAAPLPFSNKRIKAHAPAGSTVRQIVEQICPPHLKDAGVGAIVTINGDLILQKNWKRVRPKEGTVINVRIVPTGGGGGGGKNPLATVLSIAVLIAAPYAAAAYGAAAGAALGVSTALGSALVSAGVGIVGMMLVSALAPPPKPSKLGGTSVDNPAESPTQFIEGAQNVLDPFGVIPICLGYNRMVPKLAGRTFTETQGGDQYVRQLFCWGIGSKVEVSQYKIGENEIENFTGVEMSHRHDGDLNAGTALYTTNPFQEDMNVLLQQVDSWTTKTTQTDADEVILDFTMAQGLAMFNDAGKRVNQSVAVEVQYASVENSPPVFTSVPDLEITSAQTEALRESVRIIFPSRGQYFVRARRITADTDDDQILDKIALTAVKSFTYESPVNEDNCNGTALRIKGTDQLNGSVSQFNAVVKSVIPDYDVDTDTWITRASNNPASLYRYVLQGCGNLKALGDSRINLDDLAEWHTHCVEQGYTYNRVIDYEASVDDILRDVAAAGAASPAVVDGLRTVVIDKVKEDVIQIVTPRNSYGYSAELMYPDLPHAFRVQFRNAEKGYQQDEVIVYDDGYSKEGEVAGTVAATVFEVLDLQSCTNSDLAFKTGRRHIASGRLRREQHTFMQDVESICSLRGDRIKLAHDVPIIGVGDGRIASVTMSGGSPNLVNGIVLDDYITIPNTSTYYVRVRLEDGSMLYKQLSNSAGTTKTLTFTTPFTRPQTADSPPVTLLNEDDLCYVVEAGGELDLVITSIMPQDDFTAKITALDYAPAIFTAESSPIPFFESNITTPLEFIRPTPPTLLSIQSDENVMLKNSDGSYTSRAVIDLQNDNIGDVVVEVKTRISGSTVFTNANVLESRPNRLVLTGMQDGSYHDIHIRYKRVGGSMLSVPLEINNYRFVGASTPPSQVQDFKLNVIGDLAFFEWTANPEIDIDHYIIKYSGLFEGATWGTAQLRADNIRETRITMAFQSGTYLIKAVDIDGNESEDETAIITYDANLLKNVVETYDEHPLFTGTKDNVMVYDGTLLMADTSLGVGYYYFPTTLDLSAVFPASFKASILANGAFWNNLFTVDDIFSMGDVFGVGVNDVFAMNDVFAEDDVFGIGTDSWAVELQYRVTDDNTAGSPVTWTDWTALVSGTLIPFRGVQFRLKLTSLAQNVSPQVTLLSVTVDMPDRIERYEDEVVDAVTGATITYSAPFKNNPAVAITIQNGAVDDKIEFTSKTASGFTFKVYNQTTAGYVARTADCIISGYGRENT